jgi:hypothetical protein
MHSLSQTTQVHVFLVFSIQNPHHRTQNSRKRVVTFRACRVAVLLSSNRRNARTAPSLGLISFTRWLMNTFTCPPASIVVASPCPLAQGSANPRATVRGKLRVLHFCQLVSPAVASMPRIRASRASAAAAARCRSSSAGEDVAES